MNNKIHILNIRAIMFCFFYESQTKMYTELSLGLKFRAQLIDSKKNSIAKK